MNNELKSAFDIYGEGYTSEMSDTELAGRYAEQSEGEKVAILDVLDKLKLSPVDTFLDVGAGPGTFVIPISFLVAKATALDNADAMEWIKGRFSADNVDYLAGNFPDIRPQRTYSKILVYSVLQCLSDPEKVRAFVHAALDCLADGGRMLLGDLPNSDLKARFLNSETGRKFDAEWRASRKPSPTGVSQFQANIALSGMLGTFDDAFLLLLMGEIRARGCHTYLLPQRPDMPFGNTREDILVVKPA